MNTDSKIIIKICVYLCSSVVNLMLALLILAAGESSRMRFPKALLKIGEETFVECILRKAKAAGLTSVFVITGADHEKIISVFPQIPCVHNENYMQGQISSLQKGIRNLPEGITEVMVWPVDQPLIKKETVITLIEHWNEKKKALTIPVYQDHKGHPVIYNNAAMKAAVKLQMHQTGKDLQSLFAMDMALVEVADPAVAIDIDTPEDYEKYVKS
jgi:molybdenum cofactor cytidylyltransferase